jgi:RecG-like helicase
MTKISQNQRMFVITPLITDSEHLDEVKSALTEYEWIKQTYPELEGEI